MVPPSLVLGMAVLTLGDGPRGPLDEALAAAVAARRERQISIRSIDCSYKLTSVPTKYWTAEVAKQSKVPLDVTERNLTTSLHCRSVEAAPDLYRLDQSGPGHSSGLKSETRSLLCDGKGTRELTVRETQDGTKTSSVRLGGKIQSMYAQSNAARAILGDTVLAGEPSPIAAIIEGSAARCTGRETIDGHECIVVTWEGVVNRANTRNTVWLDTRHQYALVRYVNDGQNPANSKWSTFLVWKVSELASTPFKLTTGKFGVYWYPRVVTREVLSSTGDGENTETIVIEKLDLNKDVPPSHFAPRIEDGSAVHDVRTGRIRVQGNGPSPELRRLVEKQVRRTKEKLWEEVAKGPRPGVMNPPRPTSWYISAIAWFVGAGGLIAALLVWRGGRPSV